MATIKTLTTIGNGSGSTQETTETNSTREPTMMNGIFGKFGPAAAETNSAKETAPSSNTGANANPSAGGTSGDGTTSSANNGYAPIGMAAMRPAGYTPTEVVAPTGAGAGTTGAGAGATTSAIDAASGFAGNLGSAIGELFADGSVDGRNSGGSKPKVDPVTGEPTNDYDAQVEAGAAQTQKLADQVDMTPQIDAANQAWNEVNQDYADKTGDIIKKTGEEQQGAINQYKEGTGATIDALKGLTDAELAAYARASNITIEQARDQINAVLQGLESLPNANVGRVNHVDTTEQENLLSQLTESQKQQASQAVDYTVRQGVNELNRAMEDAAVQYQTQRNQIASDEERAKANQALYNEMRGDRGGVGQSQYDAIANAAATNQRTVNSEQTKLSTDTARQIADLRAKGEFEKADKLLQISQEYLGQLMNLKQWADETNLGVDEFNVGIDEWEQEYNLKVNELLAEMKTSAAQWQASTELGNQQYITGQNINAAQTDASLRLSQQDTVRQATQELSQQLASLGLSNAESVSNALINQITAILDARTSNAGNVANAELSAAKTTGAFSNGTATADMWANNQSQLAKAAEALMAAGVQLTPDQIAAMGMTIAEYNSKTPAQWKKLYS